MIRTANLLAGLLAVSLAGCGQSAGSPQTDIAAIRTQFILTVEPADAIGLLEARDSQDHSEIVLVAKIPARPYPWKKGSALFLVADAPGATSKAGHTHVCEGCPFCSKNQEDRVAVVEFVDHAGQVLPYDAQQLFGVEHNQIVVVRGKPRVDELGGLVISASGLYIRR